MQLKYVFINFSTPLMVYPVIYHEAGGVYKVKMSLYYMIHQDQEEKNK